MYFIITKLDQREAMLRIHAMLIGEDEICLVWRFLGAHAEFDDIPAIGAFLYAP